MIIKRDLQGIAPFFASKRDVSMLSHMYSILTRSVTVLYRKCSEIIIPEEELSPRGIQIIAEPGK